MNLSDAAPAWYILGGVASGLLLAAGYAWWITGRVHSTIKEAREVVVEMLKVVNTANRLAHHVSAEYAPLKLRVDELERKVAALLKNVVCPRDSLPEEDD